MNQYDTGNFPEGDLNTTITYEIDYQTAMHAVNDLKCELKEKHEATDLFGYPKDDSFAGDWDICIFVYNSSTHKHTMSHYQHLKISPVLELLQ